jgi:outer membrane protein OmpA-like peptidoglycan-associated protein
LKPQHQSIEENGPKVPGYIVTFSDMVTLLLTFFVMLLSLASVQDPELVNVGRDSFFESIRNLGLGMLSGKRPKPDFGYVKTMHFISKPDKLFEGRTIHAKEEEIRRIFNELSQSMKILPSQANSRKSNFSVTNIHFPQDRFDLNESARKFLRGFCLDLQQDAGRKPIELYVLGLADGGKSEEEQWLLSAKRARTVADYLRDTLSSAQDFQGQQSLLEGQSKWSVYSWGAGPGGDWVGRDSPISKQSQILIAVLRASD